VRLEYRHQDPRKAEEDAHSMAAQLQKILADTDRRSTDMIGPAPCFYARLNREYRWQIILRGPDPASLLRDMKLVSWRVEVNPIGLL
jgi:primosomal protein N' (replication factor Y)